MAPGKTVSKLRSTPAPYLAQAPAPKLGVGVDLNRDRDRVSCLLGPDLTEGRTVSHRDKLATSLRYAADFKWFAQRTLRNARFRPRVSTFDSRKDAPPIAEATALHPTVPRSRLRSSQSYGIPRTRASTAALLSPGHVTCIRSRPRNSGLRSTHRRWRNSTSGTPIRVAPSKWMLHDEAPQRSNTQRDFVGTHAIPHPVTRECFPNCRGVLSNVLHHQSARCR